MANRKVDAEYLKEVEEARRELRDLIANKSCAPIMLRLAWHDAGTYDVQSKTGGPNGSIRIEQEYSQPANRGLKVAIDLCEGVKSKHPTISYADLYQLAGVVAVNVCGGPLIDFVPGREDSDVVIGEGRLPDANQGFKHLRDVFYRMGLTDKDTVALSGAHTLGRAHPERSGFDGPWTREPLLFDNSYFVELQKNKETGLLKLSTDKALLEDPEFRYYVNLYAMDADKFRSDYIKSHKKLSELGFNPCSSEAKAVAAEDTSSASDQNREVVLQDIFDKDVVKDNETEAIGQVSAGKVFPIAQDQPFILREEVTLVDRNFSIGDVVSRVGETMKVGVVVASSKVVDLEDVDGDRVKDVPVEDIGRIRGFFEDDVVIYKDSWLGTVTETDLSVKMKFEDGERLRMVYPNPEDLVPVFTNALERLLDVPYYLNQTIIKEHPEEDGETVRGVVIDHEAIRVHVEWNEVDRTNAAERALFLPNNVSTDELRLLRPPSVANAGWMLGQRCVREGMEFLICNVHPTKVTVTWENGLEEEVEGRSLVRAELAGGFFEGSNYQIGTTLTRLQLRGKLPTFGVIKGVVNAGRCLKVEWEDGSIGTVDPEDSDSDWDDGDAEYEEEKIVYGDSTSDSDSDWDNDGDNVANEHGEAEADSDSDSDDDDDDDDDGGMVID